MSSAYHPQSDGQTKVLNRVIEQYLRSFVHHKPRLWGKLLPWVEWSHNSPWNAGTGSTPFEITFGRKPFTFPEYLTGYSNIEAVEEMMSDRDNTFQLIRKKLLKSQESMKKQADSHRREVNYKEGDWVLLKLRPRRQSTTKGAEATIGKLAKRFYGPFKILQHIGLVAYKLQLPEASQIHPVFHCSLLKPFHGSPEQVPELKLPTDFFDSQPLVFPLAILDYRRDS